jgi:Zn ribbon nucleic-acid-binding protein
MQFRPRRLQGFRYFRGRRADSVRAIECVACGVEMRAENKKNRYTNREEKFDLLTRFVQLKLFMKRPHKILIAAFGLVLSLSFTSCKKCYVCTCTDNNTAFGCTQLGEELEMCDRGLIGKTTLTARVLEKESEGYTCTVK